MPRQGNTVESCIIVDWKINEGDDVTDETIVCEVETDKATFEIPAGSAGKVLKILCNAGDDVPVLSPIAVIGASGENWQDLLENTSRKDAEPVRQTQRSQSNEKENINTSDNKNNSSQEEINQTTSSIFGVNQMSDAQNSNSDKFISPRARNLAEKEALSPETVPGTGPEGRIIERDVLAALEQRPGMTAAAKAAAAKVAGAKAMPFQGTGIGGRVTTNDIASFSAAGITSSYKDKEPIQDTFTETPIRGIRKVISDRMLKSLAETAQFTLNASAPVSRLQDIRTRLKTTDYLPEEFKSLKITVNDLILFAVSRILPRFSYMNVHKTGDTIKTFNMVHLGLAVDTPRGLMVPVIRNADLLSLAQISSEVKRLAASCQNGTAKPDELSGSTFTVTNLGSLGITSFTPVLNTPEVAILGVCGIEMKPIASSVNECCCKCAPHIGFSLTINHQVVDGAPAARFLKALCDAVADIDLLLAAG